MMEDRSLTRRSFLKNLVKGSAIVGLSGLLPTFGKNVYGKNYIFALDWIKYGRHAPYHSALHTDLYKSEGLPIDIVRGYGSYDTIKRVGRGKATFGFGDMGSLVVARSEGIPVNCVGMVYYKAPYALYSLRKTGINTPKDLEGHTIAATAGEAPRKIFPVFAKINGIDLDQVKWLTVSPEAKTPMLLAGKADAVAEYKLTQPVLEKHAEKQDKEISELWFAEHGLDIYSNGLLVRESFKNSNKDLVKGFTAATYRGFEYAFQNPKKAVDILRQYKPTVDPEVALAEIGILKELMPDPKNFQHPMGWMDEKKVLETIDAVSSAYEITEPVEPGNLFSNEYLTKLS